MSKLDEKFMKGWRTSEVWLVEIAGWGYCIDGTVKEVVVGVGAFCTVRMFCS